MFGEDGKPDIPRERLRGRAEAIGRQIQELRMLQDMLHHVAGCPAPSHLECPNFRKLLEGAMPAHAADSPSSGAKVRRKARHSEG